MHSRLKKILAYKQKEVEALKKRWADTAGSRVPAPVRDFKGAIGSRDGMNVIAEIKFASPSAGRIRQPGDPVPIGRIYEDAGAAAISFITDKRFFGGDLEQLPALKKAVFLPILRKDFILDPCQVTETFVYGADAVLLIAGILAQGRLRELLNITKDLGMTALTEVHDGHDLERAIEAGADMIGINNRDLNTFSVDPGNTFALAPLVPGDRVLVSESGISSAEDIRKLKKIGVDAVLVGTALMKSRDPGEKVKELVKAGKTEKG